MGANTYIDYRAAGSILLRLYHRPYYRVPDLDSWSLETTNQALSDANARDKETIQAYVAAGIALLRVVGLSLAGVILAAVASIWLEGR